MRFFGGFIPVLVLLTVASAADLKIKVIDPQSAAVAGAQIELLEPGGTVPLGVLPRVSPRSGGMCRLPLREPLPSSSGWLRPRKPSW